MLKNDFLNTLADAIQDHEGWQVQAASYKNHNPGNLRYVGQANATPGPQNFCVFPDFYTGRQALINDITSKLTKLQTIREIISLYAPPSENDTEAYIKTVIAFFASRNWTVTDTMPISQILAIQQPQVLIVLNQVFEPNDWHKAQAAISLCASYMPQMGFSVRYTNENLQNDLFFSPAPDGQTFEGITSARTQAILHQFNGGQEFNLLMYNSGVLQLTGTPAGGEEQMGQAVSYIYRQTSLASVNFNSLFSAEGISREMFHELIHELFTITGDPDMLHQYLIAHGGYNANLLTDLTAIYATEFSRYLNLTLQLSRVQKVVMFLKQLLHIK